MSKKVSIAGCSQFRGVQDITLSKELSKFALSLFVVSLSSARMEAFGKRMHQIGYDIIDMK
ncbi:MAG: hypothetical protein WAK17_01405 [Candidatus Nitrosopolaris sp.]